MQNNWREKKIEIFLGLIYCGLVWGIMGDFFWTKGLIFSTDQSWGEIYSWKFIPGENWQLLKPLFFFWGQFFPMQILQKIFFLLIFGGIYFGGKKLFSLFSSNQWAIFLATIFLVFNPFFYERLVEGAQNVYSSYAVYPYFFYLTFRFWEKIIWKRGLLLVIWATILCGLSVYNILIIGGVIVFLALTAEEKKQKIFFSGLVLGGTIFLFNSFWILPMASQTSWPGQLVFSKFSVKDFSVFGPTALEPLSVEMTVLSLSGHWAEKFHRFPLVPIDHWVWWLISGGLLVLIAGGGWLVGQKKGWKKAVALLGLGGLFYFLSLGTSSVFSEKITLLLIEKVSFYRGMRETTKFMGVLPIIYGIFLVVGGEKVLAYLSWRGKSVFFAGSVLALIFWVWPLWGVVGNQLPVVQFPSDWYQLRTFFDENLKTEKNDSQAYPILILPWHAYQHFNFAQRLILNPLPRFFSQKTLSADNMEIGEIKSHSLRVESKKVEALIAGIKKEKSLNSNWLEELEKMGVEYILLAREEDWQDYLNFFSCEPNLKEVFQSENFLVWKIERKNSTQKID